MKSDNKWIVWGLIALVVLNVILLGYIFLGAGGVSLSPTDCIGGVFSNGVCTLGDRVDPSIVNIGGSSISAGPNYLNILVNPDKQTKNQLNIQSRGTDGSIGPTRVNVTGNLTINDKIWARKETKIDSGSGRISSEQNLLTIGDSISAIRLVDFKLFAANNKFVKGNWLSVHKYNDDYIEGVLDTEKLFEMSTVGQGGISSIKYDSNPSTYSKTSEMIPEKTTILEKIKNSNGGWDTNSAVQTPNGVCYVKKTQATSSSAEVTTTYFCKPNFANNGAWTCTLNGC